MEERKKELVEKQAVTPKSKEKARKPSTTDEVLEREKEERRKKELTAYEVLEREREREKHKNESGPLIIFNQWSPIAIHTLIVLTNRKLGVVAQKKKIGMIINRVWFI